MTPHKLGSRLLISQLPLKENLNMIVKLYKFLLKKNVEGDVGR